MREQEQNTAPISRSELKGQKEGEILLHKVGRIHADLFLAFSPSGGQNILISFVLFTSGSYKLLVEKDTKGIWCRK